ncbi:SsgA family sporulation/cell division regulator [Dactylosporangium sp. NPDC000244]|uniref:SsgA family sporulation/cell division regulator n=1 Tax=Dactylosporangium sp. NPDC000244 TaxID=3154365 RepID=UPI00332216ED
MTTVERKVHFRVGDGYNVGTFHFDDAEPFTVRLTFEPDSTWMFDRQLLAEALHDVAGLGDVCCWANSGRFFIRLSSPEGRAMLDCRATDVRMFLAEMSQLVPPGFEFLDIDRCLAQLLDGAA